MKKNTTAYTHMWLLLASMIAAAILAAFAFTVTIDTLLPQMGALFIAGGAVLGLAVWMALAVFTLQRAYEPLKPTRRPAPVAQRELKPEVARV